jgi:hypothetical protein
MPPVPRLWTRALVGAGVVALVSAVPLWSLVHPAAGVLSFVIGMLVTIARPSAIERHAGAWGSALRFAGAMLSVSGVLVWMSIGPLLALADFAAALVMVVFGSMIAPTGDSGAHFARFAMESTYDAPGHMVKPPGQNVGDPLDGDDDQFLGR